MPHAFTIVKMHRVQIKYISFPHINYIKYQSRAMHKRHILIIVVALYYPEINKVFNKNNTLKQTLIFNPIIHFPWIALYLFKTLRGYFWKWLTQNAQNVNGSAQKYSSLRCLLLVKNLVIFFFILAGLAVLYQSEQI